MTIAEHFIGANSNESNARRRAGAVLARLTAVSCLAMGLMLAPSHIAATASACDRDDAPPVPWTGPVPKAHCGPHDRTESGLQGSTTLAERFGGATDRGFNCNLELVGQTQGEGTSWQMAWFGDCAYYDTSNSPQQQHFGVVVVDVADPRHPKPVNYIDSVTMRDPWESLHVNAKRKLLGGVEAENGTGIGNGFEVYDVSDCRHPVLKSRIDLPNSHAHAGNWSQDGETFYVTNGFRGVGGIMPVVAVDDPANPKWLLNWQFNGEGPTARAFACAQNLPPFGFTKLIDISDERHPKEVAKLMLEVHDPVNCATTLPESLNPGFVYDSHYCNVDNAKDAKILACSYFEAGLRVFDIRDPYHPREIAYYKAPAQHTKVLPGSNLWKRTVAANFDRTADWASSFVRIRQHKGEVHIWFTSQDNGFQVVRFTNREALGEELFEERDGDDRDGNDRD